LDRLKVLIRCGWSLWAAHMRWIVRSDGLAPPVQAMVQAKRDRSRRHDANVHAVPIRNLVNLPLRPQRLDRSIRQHFRVTSKKYRHAVLGVP
jgi:hypothetical protein